MLFLFLHSLLYIHGLLFMLPMYYTVFLCILFIDINLFYITSFSPVSAWKCTVCIKIGVKYVINNSYFLFGSVIIELNGNHSDNMKKKTVPGGTLNSSTQFLI